MASQHSAPPIEARAWRLTLIMVGVLTILRIVALFATPLELYPDEAQYWLWSRHLAFGYFSKPPLIAWLIWATTAIGGDTEPWVRLSAPLLHGATALIIHRIGRRLYGGSRLFC
jgi:4-amino-4-deoxy-L-arabinose transferase-like glycosyltransferase